jgi:hypothetical protein
VVTVPDPIRDPLLGIFNCGFLSLLSGASGIGKTALVAGLAVRFRDGLSVFGHTPNVPPAIAYITADRPWADAGLWFEAVGFPEIRQYSILDDSGFAMALLRRGAAGEVALRTCLTALALPPGSLVFVDPMTLFLGGNLLDYHVVATTCIQIHRQLMDSHHCLVGLFHTSKQREDKKSRYLRAQDRITGSGALLGFTATQMNLMAPDEADRTDDVYQLLINPHHRRQETIELTKDPETGLFLFPDAAPTQVTTQLPTQPRTLSAPLMAMYRQFPEYPTLVYTAQFLQMYQDVNPKTVHERLNKLLATGLIERVARGAWRKVPLHYDDLPS